MLWRRRRSVGARAQRGRGRAMSGCAANGAQRREGVLSGVERRRWRNGGLWCAGGREGHSVQGARRRSLAVVMRPGLLEPELELEL